VEVTHEAGTIPLPPELTLTLTLTLTLALALALALRMTPFRWWRSWWGWCRLARDG